LLYEWDDVFMVFTFIQGVEKYTGRTEARCHRAKQLEENLEGRPKTRFKRIFVLRFNFWRYNRKLTDELFQKTLNYVCWCLEASFIIIEVKVCEADIFSLEVFDDNWTKSLIYISACSNVMKDFPAPA
jgi:hypothetical protein